MFILKSIIKYVKGTNHWVGKNIFTHWICLTKGMEQNPSWEAYSFSINQLVSTFYGTQIFIIMSTVACHWSLSWINEYSPLGHPKFFWHLAFSLKNFVHFLSLLNVLDTLSVSLSLTWSPYLVCLKGTNYDARPHAVFFIIMLLPLTRVQVFSATYSLTLQMYVLPFGCETKFMPMQNKWWNIPKYEAYGTPSAYFFLLKPCCNIFSYLSTVMRLGKKKEKEKESEPKSQTVEGVSRLICSTKTHSVPLKGNTYALK